MLRSPRHGCRGLDLLHSAPEYHLRLRWVMWARVPTVSMLVARSLSRRTEFVHLPCVDRHHQLAERTLLLQAAVAASPACRPWVS